MTNPTMQMMTSKNPRKMMTEQRMTIGVERATEIITAAWQLYRQNGWADRPLRNVVNDGIYQLTEPTDGHTQMGDMLVPSLFKTVRDNIVWESGLGETEDRMSLDITAEIQKQARIDRDLVMQDTVWRKLLDDANDFGNTILACLQKGQVNMNDIKRLCYITTMADRVRQDHAKQELLASAKDEALAPIGHTAEVSLIILNTTYSQAYGTYNHQAITDEGHVVSFFNKNKHEPNTKMVITGNVKDHRRMFRNEHIAETRLNYVKIKRILTDGDEIGT